MKVESITELIGNTPHINISNFFEEAKKKNISVWMKLERQNPGGSIKDRIALNMIEDAEKKGNLQKGYTIVEPTSGNTGIGIAMVGAAKGYKTVLVMPESMSIERRNILKAYGAELVLTPKEKGMKGAIEKATEITEQDKSSWMPMQFDNLANPEVHARTTAEEIAKDFDQVDYLITGVGTGGHITGVSEKLKQKYETMQTFAVEPEDSPVISGGAPGPHAIQGIGAGFIPSVLKTDLLDGAITVSKDEAFSFARKLAHEYGILVGISTGASLAAVHKKLAEMKDGSIVLTFNYDTGERYLSCEGLF